MNAPIEKIDIGAWLLSLPSPEYERCAPPDHIAAGASTTDDGTPMSINVEMIGDSLIVQKYVGEEVSPSYCRMVSESDVFTPHGRTTIQVVWELSATRIDDRRSEYKNVVTSFPTDQFLAFIEKGGLTFEQATAARQTATSDHCSRETPLYAASIEKHALSR
ncbi:hypothetical protein [Streptomyces sp. NPDC096934]|uniref:hypothetical protein n=1 Tax=Streptomyces sp. NPDC096934 TaxID=3155551 RepID=UPI00331C750A